MMKLGQLIPKSVKSSSLYRRLHPRALFNAFRDPADIFTKIYETNDWGGEQGTIYSGSGSRGAPAEEYINFIKGFIVQHNVRSVLDLGCGDFFIGRHIAAACDHYTGIDVVPAVIRQHQIKYGSDNVKFDCLDITRAALPTADLCLIRQVLQHLSNRQIAAVVQLFGQFKYVIVSEHYPHPNEFKAPNLDTAAGSGTRVTFGSAVVLDKPPFNVSCTELSRTAAPQRDDGLQDSYTRGSIRAFLIQSK
jgi:SAM-dependent methyltransferase